MVRFITPDRIEGLIGDAAGPIIDVKKAHAQQPREVAEPEVVTAQFRPENVNDYDELIGQLARKYPDRLEPYLDGLFDRVQVPEDIPAALGTLALILDKESFPH